MYLPQQLSADAWYRTHGMCQQPPLAAETDAISSSLWFFRSAECSLVALRFLTSGDKLSYLFYLPQLYSRAHRGPGVLMFPAALLPRCQPSLVCLPDRVSTTSTWTRRPSRSMAFSEPGCCGKSGKLKQSLRLRQLASTRDR